MTTSSISSIDGSNQSSFTAGQKKTIEGTIELMKEAISTLPESERNAKSLGITALDFMNTGLFDTMEEGE
ncbi:MAG: hypothetical protein H7A40_00235 [Chlamydiales bacterium]|nr:hypothetical protein [Chlamydiales bacterium]